ncbi:hypothetical protein ENSA5_45230 [Enhygromyxa salina]|uniref:Uncharacterized protein n=1 Tax=Enhygromyxa salina TaxID=215803 RepID=A0A2S9XJR4_9BACT|nr:hypothetical protein ENSA5_45230 [Enhygromyxa salina]
MQMSSVHSLSSGVQSSSTMHGVPVAQIQVSEKIVDPPIE